MKAASRLKSTKHCRLWVLQDGRCLTLYMVTVEISVPFMSLLLISMHAHVLQGQCYSYWCLYSCHTDHDIDDCALILILVLLVLSLIFAVSAGGLIYSCTHNHTFLCFCCNCHICCWGWCCPVWSDILLMIHLYCCCRLWYQCCCRKYIYGVPVKDGEMCEIALTADFVSDGIFLLLLAYSWSSLLVVV